ncbi:MAG: aminotransferase class I/II-fold pyridoxal phosphate-dependent enzyme [Planctomycetota bacterium]
MTKVGQVTVGSLLGRLTGTRQKAEADESSSGLQPLTERLTRNKITRIALSFLDANAGLHLKDLLLDSASDDRRVTIDGHHVWNFGSDSFLGLDRHPRVHAAIRDALPEWGAHNGASRAFSSPVLVDEAEAKLAAWLGVADTFIFPSVTLANVGLLPAITQAGDLLVVDRESHNSVHQGARLAAAAGARVVELAEPEPQALEKVVAQSRGGGGLVLAIDGVYSMSGRTPPLAALDETVRRLGGIMYVDDAHGTGVVGPRGRGAAAEALGTLDNVLMVGSLSKAFSCLGGFVTCTPELKTILKIRSSTFIFGGPVPPPYLAAISAVCDIIMSPEYDTLLEGLRGRIGRFTEGLDALGIEHNGGGSAIVSLKVGDMEKTFAAGRALFDRGYYVQSATYPAVPIQGGLLRVQINANHPPESIDGLLGAVAEVWKAARLPTRRQAVAAR